LKAILNICLIALFMLSQTSCFDRLRMTSSSSRSLVTGATGSVSGSLELAEQMIDDISLALVKQQGISSAQADILAQGALEIVTREMNATSLFGTAKLFLTETVGSEHMVSRVAPMVMQAVMAQLKDEKIGVSDQDTKVAAAGTITGALFNTINTRVNDIPAAVKTKLPGTIVHKAVASLDEAGVTPAKVKNGIGNIMKETVSSLKTSGIPSEKIGETVALVAKESMTALSSTGISQSGMQSAAKELVSNTVAALGTLKTAGKIETSGISGIVGPVMASAVGALKSTGAATAGQMQSIVGEMMSGAVVGLGKTDVGKGEALTSAISAAATHTVNGLKEAGLKPAEVAGTLGNVMSGAITALGTIGVTEVESIEDVSATVSSSTIAATVSMITASQTSSADMSSALKVATKAVAEGTMSGLGNLAKTNAIDPNQLPAATAAVTQKSIEALYTSTQNNSSLAFTTVITDTFAEGVVSGLAVSGMDQRTLSSFSANISTGITAALTVVAAADTNIEAKTFADAGGKAASNWTTEMMIHCEQDGGKWKTDTQTCEYPKAAPVAEALGPTPEEDLACAQQGGVILYREDQSYFCKVPDKTPPTDPLSPIFSVASTRTSSLTLSWGASTDPDFLTHNVKLCKAKDCTSFCTTMVLNEGTTRAFGSLDDGNYFGCVQGVDKNGNRSAWVASAAAALVDTTSPTVSAVTTAAANGYYGAGKTMVIDVILSEPVTVTNPSGIILTLNTGAKPTTLKLATSDVSNLNGVPATIHPTPAVQPLSPPATGIAATRYLRFVYTVGATDMSSKLGYVGPDSLTLAAGSDILDLVGNKANLTLPAPETAAALDGNKHLVIDTAKPLASSLSINGGALYAVSRNVSLTLAGSGADEMFISNSSDCSAAAVWEPYAASKAWLLGAQNGTANVSIKLRDYAYNESSCITASINLDDTPPTANAGSDVTTASDITLTASATDAASYQWTQVSGPGTVTFTSPTALSTSASANQDGTYVIRFTATDIAGNSVSDTLNFIRDTLAPVVNAGTDLTAGTVVILTPFDTADATTYSWSQVSGSGTLTFGTPSNRSTTVSASAEGVYTVRLTATDAAGNSGSDDLLLTWDTIPPTVDAGADLVKNSGFLLDAVTSGAVSYSWTKVSGSGSVTFMTPNAEDTDISATVDDTYVLRLTATDAAGNSSFDEVTLIWDTTAPSVSAGPDVTVAALATLDAATTGASSWSWQMVSGPGTVTFGSPAAEDTTASASVDGIYTLRLTATDAAGNSSFDELILNRDTTGPHIVEVTSRAAHGYYGPGASIVVEAVFNEPVKISNLGGITLTLETGATDAVISASEFGTNSAPFTVIDVPTVVINPPPLDLVTVPDNRKIKFTYYVSMDHNTELLGYAAGATLQLTGGALIGDALDNMANLALPSPGTSAALDGNRQIVIDSLIPDTPSSVTWSTPGGSGLIAEASWDSVSDASLGVYSYRACMDLSCSAGCISFGSTELTTINMTLSANVDYYACVRAVDKAGNMSYFTSSNTPVKLSPPCSAYSDGESCRQSGGFMCEWSGSSCGDRSPCYSLVDSPSCTANASCTWGANACVPLNAISSFAAIEPADPAPQIRKGTPILTAAYFNESIGTAVYGPNIYLATSGSGDSQLHISTDDGSTWGAPLGIRDANGDKLHGNDFSVAYNSTSGTDYIHVLAGKQYARSTNGGISWSVSAIDGSEDDGRGSLRNAMIADDSGFVAALYLTRGYADSETMLKLAISQNSGASFTNYSDGAHVDALTMVNNGDIQASIVTNGPYVYVVEFIRDYNTMLRFLRFARSGGTLVFEHEADLTPSGVNISYDAPFLAASGSNVDITIAGLNLHSSDNGATFTTTNFAPQGNFAVGAALKYGADRTIVYFDYALHQLMTTRWENGTSWSTPKTLAQVIMTKGTELIQTTSGKLLALYSSTAHDQILMTRSSDGGVTWSSESNTIAYQIPGTVMDNGGSDYDDRITMGSYIDTVAEPDVAYLYSLHHNSTGMQRLSRSTDGGSTWSVTRVPHLAGGSSAMAVSSTGRLFIAATDNAANVPLTLAVSNDNGETWGYRVVDTNSSAAKDSTLSIATNGSNVYLCYVKTSGVPPSETYALWFAKSSDGGNTFTTKHITMTGGGATCAVGGQTAGAEYIYLSYIASDNMSRLNAFVSSDGGTTFTNQSGLICLYGTGSDSSLTTNCSYAKINYDDHGDKGGMGLPPTSIFVTPTDAYITGLGAMLRAPHGSSFNPPSTLRGSGRVVGITAQGSALAVTTIVDPAQMLLMRSTDNGTIWSAAVSLDGYDADHMPIAQTDLGSQTFVGSASFAKLPEATTKALQFTTLCSAAGDSSSCSAILGCSYVSGSCVPTPFSCSAEANPMMCERMGCSWNGAGCELTSSVCQRQTTAADCHNMGCSYSNGYCIIGSSATAFAGVTQPNPNPVNITTGNQVVSGSKFGDRLVGFSRENNQWLLYHTDGQGLQLKRQTSGNWGAAVDVRSSSDSLHGSSIGMTVTRGGEPDYAYTLHVLADKIYARSTDNGASWSTTDLDPGFTNNSNSSGNALISDGTGRIIALYTVGSYPAEELRLKYSDDNGVNWSAPLYVANGSYWRGPVAMTFDGGKGYLTYFGSTYYDGSDHYQLKMRVLYENGSLSPPETATVYEFSPDFNTSDLLNVIKVSGTQIEVLTRTHLIRSVDSGVSYQVYPIGGGDKGWIVGADYISSGAGKVIVGYDANRKQLIRQNSYDNGMTWNDPVKIADVAYGRKVALVKGATTGEYHVYFTPMAADSILVTTTSDNGQTFTSTAGTYAVHGVTTDNNDFSYNDRSLIAAEGSNVFTLHRDQNWNARLSRSSDGGASWQSGTLTGMPSGSLALAADSSTPGKIYVAAADSSSSSSYENPSAIRPVLLGRSEDYGATFQYSYVDSHPITGPESTIDMAVSGSNVYLCYTVYANPSDPSSSMKYVKFARLTSEGVNVAAPQQIGMISAGSYGSVTCSLAVSGNYAYIAYKSSSLGYIYIVTCNLTDNSCIENSVSTPANYYGYPTVAANASGVYVLDGSTLYRRLSSASGPFDLTGLSIHVSNVKASTLMSSGSSLYAAAVTHSGRLYLTRSDNNGLGWSAPVVMDQHDAAAWKPGLALANGTIMAAYQSAAHLPNIATQAVGVPVPTAATFACGGLDQSTCKDAGCSWNGASCEMSESVCSSASAPTCTTGDCALLCENKGCTWNSGLSTCYIGTASSSYANATAITSVNTAEGKTAVTGSGIRRSLAAAVGSSDGYLHLAYVDGAGLKIVESSDGGNIWSATPVLLTVAGNPLYANNLSLAVTGADTAKKWHILADHTYLQASYNGSTWSTTKTLLDSYGFSGSESSLVTIKATESGDVYALLTSYDAGYNRLWLAHSCDFGATWKVGTCTGGTEGQNQMIYQASADIIADMVLDGPAGIHVAVQTNSSGMSTMRYFFSSDKGATFSSPTAANPINITPNPVYYGDAPALYAAGQTINIVSGATVVRSADGGLSWSDSSLTSTSSSISVYGASVTAGEALSTRVAMFFDSYAKKIRAARSVDSGMNWSLTGELADLADGRKVVLVKDINSYYGFYIRTTGDQIQFLKAAVSPTVESDGTAWSGNAGGGTFTVTGSVINNSFGGGPLSMGSYGPEVYALHRDSHGKAVLMRSADGANWQYGTLPSADASSGAAMAVGSDGSIYVVTAGGSSSSPVMLARSTNQGTNWNYWPVNGTTSVNYQNRLHILSNQSGGEDKIHVCYVDSSSNLKVATFSTLPSFGLDSNITVAPVSGSVRCTLGASGSTIFAVYTEDGASNIVKLARSIDDGMTFSGAISLYQDPEIGYAAPAVALNDTHLYVSVSSQLLRIPLSHDLSVPYPLVGYPYRLKFGGMSAMNSSIVLNNQNVIVMFGTHDNKLLLARSADAGLSWSTPATLDSSDADSGAFAAVLDGTGSLYSVFLSVSRLQGVGTKVMKHYGSCAAAATEAQCSYNSSSNPMPLGCSWNGASCEPSYLYCSTSGEGCYGNNAALSYGLARTVSGKPLQLTDLGTQMNQNQLIWRESLGAKLLAANGSDSWQMGLNSDGMSYSASPFLLTESPYNLAGRACPLNVYLDDTNKFAVGRCLYYDSAETYNTLGNYGLTSWNTYNAGAPKWFVANISACSNKGMRLPTLYETSAGGSGYAPTTDGSPAYDGMKGIPINTMIWTATANGTVTDNYLTISGGGTVATHPYSDMANIMCVLP
jgi:hypothetical protein